MSWVWVGPFEVGWWFGWLVVCVNIQDPVVNDQQVGNSLVGDLFGCLFFSEYFMELNHY